MPDDGLFGHFLCFTIDKPNKVDSSGVLRELFCNLLHLYNPLIWVLLVLGDNKLSVHAVRVDCQSLLGPFQRLRDLNPFVFVDVDNIFVTGHKVRPYVNNFLIVLHCLIVVPLIRNHDSVTEQKLP